MIERWKNLWRQSGKTEKTDDLYDQVIRAYTAENRFYHNLNHITHCLAELDLVKDQLASPAEVELAIWFHDIVYDTRSARNEEESAQLAVSQLRNAGVTGIDIEKVRDLILATKHDRPIRDSDAGYLVDIDISIFGHPPDLYMEYERNIRREYAWVPDTIFRAKRKDVLKSFLDRDQIFFTVFFSNRYERQARANLEAAIKL